MHTRTHSTPLRAYKHAPARQLHAVGDERFEHPVEVLVGHAFATKRVSDHLGQEAAPALPVSHSLVLPPRYIQLGTLVGFGGTGDGLGHLGVVDEVGVCVRV